MVEPDKLLLAEKSKDAVALTRGRLNRKPDQNLLDDSRCYDASLDEPLVEGRFNIEFDGINFKCFLKRSETQRLYVILGGGRWRGSDELASYPSFSRWNYYTILDGSLLCIDDPMYEAHPDLVTGWFYGTESVNYRKVVAGLIKKISKNLEIPQKDIVFVSSLANSSASIHVACLIRDSSIISVNPTFDLKKTGEGFGFKKSTGIDIKTSDKFGRNDLYDLVFKSNTNKFLVLCNVTSPQDYEVQTKPIFQQYGVEPVFGLNKLSDNFYVWLYDAPAITNNPHNSIEDMALFPMIDYVFKNVDSEKNDSIADFVLNVGNKIWYDHYAQKRRIHELQS